MLKKKLLIKICGMRDALNISEIVSLSPDYLGFIFFNRSPRNAGGWSLDLDAFPARIKKTGVFVNEEIQKVAETIKRYGLQAVQLHGSESPDYCKQIKHECGTEIIKAFGIHKDFDFQELRPYLPVIDYFLFDTATKDFGGSGKAFNWGELKNYPFEKPYFLSGGISISHAAEIKQLEDERLAGVDINSRFELQPGWKDAGMIKEFLNQLLQD